MTEEATEKATNTGMHPGREETVLRHEGNDGRPEMASGYVFLCDLFGNLRAGLGFAAFSPAASRTLRPAVAQVLTLWALAVLVEFVAAVLRIGVNGRFFAGGIAFEVYGCFLIALTAWAGARAAGNESLGVRAATALSATSLVFSLLWSLMGSLPVTFWQELGQGALILWWTPFAWLALACVVAIVRSCGMLPEQRVGAILAVLCLFVTPHFFISQNTGLWYPAAQAREETPDPRWDHVANEDVIYRQPDLLDEALDKVVPGRKGVPELYLVAAAGHGAQDVFMREVLSVDRLFAERFGTAGHSVVLVNNPATVLERPMATVTALDEALREVGAKMNPEDVLFLFLTSHGAQDFHFDLSLWPYEINELTPEVLRDMLDKAGIRHRVIVVSACFSGGFVPRLASPDTLVMSAAREDRSSHGCSHEADWTFFGRAYFDEALRQTRSFEAAFEQAKVAIAKREKEEGVTPSEPQIAIGARIRAALKPFEK